MNISAALRVLFLEIASRRFVDCLQWTSSHPWPRPGVRLLSALIPTGQIVVVQQYLVLHRSMPTLDLALGLRVIRPARVSTMPLSSR